MDLHDINTGNKVNWLLKLLSFLHKLLSKTPEIIIPPQVDFELSSPGYWLKPEATGQPITKESLNVLLEEDPAVWITTVADTNSMDTFFDYRHTVTLIAGRTELDHQRILDWLIPGDIVVYEVSGATIIHAVKKITIDALKGRIWTTQGLNPLITWYDPYELTDSNIKFVAVRIEYTDRI